MGTILANLPPGGPCPRSCRPRTASCISTGTSLLPRSQPAWRTKPSWYLVATDDHMIPPPAQRAMAERAGCTVSQVSASHSPYVSQRAATADLIKQAGQGAAAY